MGTKGERREAKQRRRRLGHKVDGRSVLVLQEQIMKRAEEARRQQKEGRK